MTNLRLWQKIGIQGGSNKRLPQPDIIFPNEIMNRMNKLASNSQSQLGIFQKNKKSQSESSIHLFKKPSHQVSQDSFLDNNKSQLLYKPLRISIKHQNQKQSIIKCQSQQYNEDDNNVNIGKSRMSYYDIQQRQINMSNKKAKSTFKQNLIGMKLLILLLNQQNKNIKNYLNNQMKSFKTWKESINKQMIQKTNKMMSQILNVTSKDYEVKIAQINKNYQIIQQNYKRCQFNYSVLQQKYNAQIQKNRKLQQNKNIQVNKIQKDIDNDIKLKLKIKKNQFQQKKAFRTQMSQSPKQKQKLKFQFHQNDNSLALQKVEKQYQRKLFQIEAQMNQIIHSYNQIIERIMDQKNIIQHQHCIMQDKLQVILQQIQILKQKNMRREENHKEQCNILLNRLKQQQLMTSRSRSQEKQRSLPSFIQKFNTKQKRHYHTILDDLQNAHNFSDYIVEEQPRSFNRIQVSKQRNKWIKDPSSSANKNVIDAEVLLCKNRQKNINNNYRLRGKINNHDSQVFDKALQNLNQLQRGVRMQINKSKLNRN